MSDELKLNEDLAKAARAQALLGDELLNECFSKLEALYQSEWKITHVADVHARERLWMAVNIIGKVKDHMTKLVSNGKIAQRELDDLAGKQKRRLLGIV
jgi:hypothetical protein